jgi:hypothetical protein
MNKNGVRSKRVSALNAEADHGASNILTINNGIRKNAGKWGGRSGKDAAAERARRSHFLDASFNEMFRRQFNFPRALIAINVKHLRASSF